MNGTIEVLLKNILFFIVFSLVMIYWFKHSSIKRKSYNIPPLFPGALPIIGHTLTLLKYGRDLWGLYRYIMDYVINNGHNIITFKWGNLVLYLPVHTNDCNILANKCLEKHFGYKIAKTFLGDGLITGNVSTWKIHRKLLNPTMSHQFVNGFMDSFNQQSKKLVIALMAKAGKGTFDHLPVVSHVSESSICSNIIGYKGNKPTDKFHSQLLELNDLFFHLLMERIRKPWLLNDFFFKLSSLKKHYDEIAASFSTLIDKIIHEKEMATKTKEEISKDCKSVLDFMLQLKSKRMLTHQDVKDEILTMIFAAYDTSFISISQTMILLGSYPEVQEKVYEELQEIFGDSDRDVTKEDLSRMKYLDAAAKESLRLYPTVPVVVRELDENVNIGEYTLRAGDGVVFSLYDINRHVGSWGHDAGVFRPERWLDVATVPKKAYAAFSIGRRNCIGKYYAMVNLKTALAYVMRRYKITADFSKVKYESIINLYPVSGHHISLEER